MDDNGDPYQNSLFQNEQRLKLNKHKPNKFEQDLMKAFRVFD